MSDLLLKQDRHRSIEGVGNSKVELSVTVEICRGECQWVAAHRIRRAQRLGERAITLPEQKRNCSVREVCYRKVQFPVVVKVAHDDGLWLISHRNRSWRYEGSIAVAEKDKHSVASGVCHRDVQLAIAVEVAGHYGGKVLAEGNRRTACRSKRAVTVAKRNGNSGSRNHGGAGAGH